MPCSVTPFLCRAPIERFRLTPESLRLLAAQLWGLASQISSGGDEVNQFLNRGIGLVVGGFDFGGRWGAASGWVVKQAVSQRAADALVKEDEHGGHSGSLFREAVGVALAHPLQQAMAFHLA